MKNIFVILVLLFSYTMSLHASPLTAKNAYGFTFQKLSSKDKLPLSSFKGKVVLVVNTASKCGFTSQYEGLQKIYDEFKSKGLVVVGVPSNDFGGQEPGTEGEIATFCKKNYGVTFYMTKKEIVSGDEAHPFYKWAKDTLGDDNTPSWNFYKYLIDRKGKLIEGISSKVNPDSEDFRMKIKKLL